MAAIAVMTVLVAIAAIFSFQDSSYAGQIGLHGPLNAANLQTFCYIENKTVFYSSLL